MPELGKGTECLKLPLSLASKGINQTLVPLFLPFRKYMNEIESLCFDQKSEELTASKYIVSYI